MPEAIFASAAAVKKALELLVEDCYQLVKLQGGKHIKKWRAQSQIPTLYKKMKNFRMVKTIWQVEKEVDLGRFYYPSKIVFGHERTTISTLRDFPHGGNIVIEGIVGQGKSIFFRYLTAIALQQGEAVPVFTELRRILPEQSLTNHILEELKSLGLDWDEQTFLLLASAGKVILILDGFDEVPEEHRQRLTTEIETLAKRHDSLRILVSSRPNSGIASSPFFRVMQLSPLQDDEYEGVIKRITQDKKIADQIILGVDRHRNIRALLTTPLMVALLVFRFRAEQTIPENALEFYNHLFLLLLQRHDKSKGGYIRPRKCKLSDAAIERIFDAFCFITRKQGKRIYTSKDVHKCMDRAVELALPEADPAKVLFDIVRITCLVLEEADEYRFIHNSVQEFHSAGFIESQPDGAAQSFYEAMLSRWRPWLPELAFLASTDRYRYLKWFFVPDCCEALGVDTDNISKRYRAGEKLKTRILSSYKVDVSAKFKRVWAVHHPVTPVNANWTLENVIGREVVGGLLSLDATQLVKAVPSGKIRPETEEIKESDTCVLSVGDILAAGLLKKKLDGIVSGACDSAFQQLVVAREFVVRTEEAKSVLEF